MLSELPATIRGEPAIEKSVQKDGIFPENFEKEDTKMLFSPKRQTKMSRDNKDPRNSQKENEIDFTEWFENEVDAFIIEHHKNTTVLNKENLQSILSSVKP